MWGASPNLLRVWMEQKGGGKDSLFLYLTWHPSSFVQSGPGSQTFRIYTWNLHHHLSGSQDYKLHRLSWGSSLQRADGISSQPPWSCEPVPYNRSLYRYMLLVPFLWRPLTNSLYWFNFHIFSDLHLSFLATSLKADTWWIFTIIFSIPIKLYYAPLIHNRHSVKTFN